MFQKTIVEKYLSKIDTTVLTEKYNQFCSIFQNEKKIENIRNSKEEQYQEGFIRDLFVSVLGYTIKPEENYNILTELKNEVANKSNSKKSDGAICEENNENKIRVVIELKGTDTTDLDKVAFQAFSYKNFHSECNYVIVSNFERLRMYVETQSDFEEFNLFNLSYDRFCILYLLLELHQLKADIPLILKHETLSEEKQITDNFYADYSTFKRLLFEDLIENNPETDKLVLFKKTQKLLDRILFILFCEDRNLLPANSVAGIIKTYQELKKMGFGQPLYEVFKNYFTRIDKGYKDENDSSKNIFAYNGGLFKTDEILDNIKVGDDVLFIHTRRLAEYDFESQISVDILGRIFENSLTEIEEVQQQIEAEKTGQKIETTNVGKRKKDGVFYTPEYITKYIVENTIGKLCQEKRTEYKIDDEYFAANAKYTKKQLEDLDSRLTDYRNWLLGLKILDPACGSGAFLNAALSQLKKEHALIDSYYANIHQNALNFDTIDNDTSILENNLYGVDINEDSIEITKLSLWLHTAKKDRKLTTLNGKIKCGNSLIDDETVAGEKAFNWEKEFPEVFEKGGFDIVIGNPPYISSDTQMSNKQLTEQRNEIIRSNRFKSLYQKWDIYIPFIELGLNLLKDNGLLSMIVPYPLTNQTYGKEIRKIMTINYNLFEMVDLNGTKIFADAMVSNCIPFIKKSLPENKVSISRINTNKVISKVFEKSYNNLIQDTNSYVFNLTNENRNLDKYSNMKVLGDFCYISKGMVLNSDEKTAKGEFVKEDLISFTKDQIHCKEYIEGKDIEKYSINRIRYLEYDTDRVPSKLSRPTFPELYTSKKILTSKIGELKAIIDYQNLYCDQTNRICILWTDLKNVENKSITSSIKKFSKLTREEMEKLSENVDIKYLLGIMNSKYATFLLDSIRGVGNIDLNPEYIRKIPIPEIPLTEQTPFIELADKMLSLNEQFQKKSANFLKVVKQSFSIEKPSTKLENFHELDFDGFIKELKQKITPKIKLEWLEVFEDTKKELLKLKQQIDSTDKQINQLVYKLYNLTDEEIAIVEGN